MASFRTQFYMLLVVLTSLAVVMIYTAWPSVHSSLREFKLIPTEEPLTELYFNDVETLPQSAARPLTFSFTIHNMEGEDMTYLYVVSAEFPDGRVVVLDRSTVPITDGDAVRIPESLRLSASGKARIIVEIPQQQISFLLK